MKHLKLRRRLLAPLAVAVTAGLVLLIGGALLPSGNHGASAAGTFDPTGVVCMDINNKTIFTAIPREVKILNRIEVSKKGTANQWDITSVAIVGDTNGDGVPDTVPTTQDCKTKTEPGVLTPGVVPLGGGPAGRPGATATKKGNRLVWDVCSFEENFGWVMTRFDLDITGAKTLDQVNGTNTTWLSAAACETEIDVPSSPNYVTPTYISNVHATKRLNTKGTPVAGPDDWDGDGCSDWDELDPSPFDRRGMDPFDATDCSTSASSLAGVFDAMTYLGPKDLPGMIGANHCIVRLDHNPANNKLYSQAVCLDNLGSYTFGPNDEPVNDAPGEGEGGDSLAIGPPPPPPYPLTAPGAGEGDYNPGTLTAETVTCFKGLGGPRGPNVISRVVIVDPNGQLAATGKINGTAYVFFNKSKQQCKDLDASGTPAGTFTYNRYVPKDQAPCPANNCVQAPWRTAGDQDWDNDTCDDWQELHSSRGAPCGDDPWNPYDPTGPTLDVSGNYTILATAIEADWTGGKPGGTLAPGFYYPCVADIQQGGKTLTARVNCYIDFPGITVNKNYAAAMNSNGCGPAPANQCGDGLAGGAPPGVNLAGGPRLFSYPGKKNTVLTGQLNNNTNNIELAGCFEDEEGTGALGNVYIRAKINAHTGHGSVTLWTGVTNALCVAGTPPGLGGVIPLDLVKEAPKSANRDRDSDGCPDKQELTDTPGQGGLRDPSNHYDYMNAEKDGQNRVSDILVVVGQYFQDDPPNQIDLKSQTDRTAIPGGSTIQPWNLGPPNGQQRVEDILSQVKQYFHDC